MTFSGGIPEQKFNVNRACFPKEKHQNSQKWTKFMNFSFWPFLWFGLPGQLLIFISAAPTGEAHPRNFVVKKVLFSEHCSLPLSFILITHVIVASLQVMAHNEREEEGVFREV